MAPPMAPKLAFVESTETSLVLEFTPLEDTSINSYQLQWKEYPRSWDDTDPNAVATVSRTEFAPTDKVKVEAIDLAPGTTYTLRLVAKDGEGIAGEPGPEIILDSDGVSCAPKQSGCCCSIS